MTTTLDLIPWEQAPETVEESVFTVEWKGGSFTIPRYGYLQVSELNKIAKVDPSNELYRITSKAAVELNKTLQQRATADESYSHTVLKLNQCFAFLSSLQARHYGHYPALSEIEQTIQVEFSSIIAPFLEEAKALSDRVPIRSVTVLLQRVRPGWTDEQSAKLPPPLFKIIHDFYQDEESEGKGPEDPAVQLKQLEETLGKLRQEVKSIATGQTGPAPSGNVADFGQEQQNLEEKTLASSRDPLSLQLSKPVTKRNAKGSTVKS